MNIQTYIKKIPFEEKLYYSIILLITIFIFFTNPFLKIPYDMWQHLILINSLYQTGENYTFYPENIWHSQYAWHYIWARIFRLFLVEDFFLRAKIIHVTQFLFSFYVMLYVSKVYIRNLFTSINEIATNWLSLFSVIIWFTIFGTNGTYYQQSWIMWYSINYQVTVVLYWLCTAIAIKLFFETSTHKFFLIFILLSSLTFILLWHAMEFIYFLLFIILLIMVLFNKTSSFIHRRKAVAVTLLTVLIITIILLPDIFKIILRTPKFWELVYNRDYYAFLKEIISQGMLLMSLNRASSSFNSLVIISFIALTLMTTFVIVCRNETINKQCFFLLLFTSTLFFIPFMPITGGIAGIIVDVSIVSRFIFSSTVFLVVPCACYYFFHKRKHIVYLSIILVLIISLLSSKYLPGRQHIYYDNVKSIFLSLFPSKVCIQYNKGDITLICEELSKMTENRHPTKPYLFYAKGDISCIISGIFKYCVFSIDGKSISTKAQFDTMDKYIKIVFDTPTKFPKDKILFENFDMEMK